MCVIKPLNSNRLGGKCVCVRVCWSGDLPRDDCCKGMAKHPPTEANMATEKTRYSARTVLLTMVVPWLCQPERKIRSINTKNLSKIRLIYCTIHYILHNSLA